jgi:hypothetical protein
MVTLSTRDRCWPGRGCWLLLALVVSSASACRDRSFDLSSGPRLLVKEIQLGREIDLAKRITAPAERFRPDDIVFASVVTEGAVSSTLKARWIRDGHVLGETMQRIAPDGAAASEFHVWKPSGWPKGEYQVQILVDDVPAGERRFVVE